MKLVSRTDLNVGETWKTDGQMRSLISPRSNRLASLLRLFQLAGSWSMKYVIFSAELVLTHVTAAPAGVRSAVFTMAPELALNGFGMVGELPVGQLAGAVVPEPGAVVGDVVFFLLLPHAAATSDIVTTTPNSQTF